MGFGFFENCQLGAPINVASCRPARGSPLILVAQKNVYGRLLVGKTTSKIEANLGPQKLIFEAQVGLHFGGGLGVQEAPKLASILEGSWRPMSGSQAIFLRPNMAPCWPHVSPQHEPMLDFQHEPMLEANMDLCWRPTWTHFEGQHGPILEATWTYFLSPDIEKSTLSRPRFWCFRA